MAKYCCYFSTNAASSQQMYYFTIMEKKLLWSIVYVRFNCLFYQHLKCAAVCSAQSRASKQTARGVCDSLLEAHTVL